MKFVESVFPSKEFIRISVKDSGVGISKEDQRRLFREIVQFDAAKLQKGQGSGLGLWSKFPIMLSLYFAPRHLLNLHVLTFLCLAVSSRIVRLHGGKIGVESEGDGTGSVFYIDLPIAQYHPDHPMDDLISTTLQSTYAELFHGHSVSSIQASFIKTSTKSTCSSIRSSASAAHHRRSLVQEQQPEVVYEASEDAENTPVHSPQRTRDYSSDSVNSFLFGTIKPPSPLLAALVNSPSSASVSTSRRMRAAYMSSILPEGDASPIGSDDADAPTEGHEETLEVHCLEPPSTPLPTIPFPLLSPPPAVSSPSPATSRASPQSISRPRTAAVETDYQLFFERRILIVDDAPSNRKVVNHLLRDKIAHRDEAQNGLAACEMVQASLTAQRPYDCVLLDYFMPEMDGPGAARRMREMGYTGLIVGVTGNNDVADIALFQQAGVNHVVVKPLDANAFWKILSGKSTECSYRK